MLVSLAKERRSSGVEVPYLQLLDAANTVDPSGRKVEEGYRPPQSTTEDGSRPPYAIFCTPE
jgi:hypothetical protein